MYKGLPPDQWWLLSLRRAIYHHSQPAMQCLKAIFSCIHHVLICILVHSQLTVVQFTVFLQNTDNCIQRAVKLALFSKIFHTNYNLQTSYDIWFYHHIIICHSITNSFSKIKCKGKVFWMYIVHVLHFALSAFQDSQTLRWTVQVAPKFTLDIIFTILIYLHFVFKFSCQDWHLISESWITEAFYEELIFFSIFLTFKVHIKPKKKIELSTKSKCFWHLNTQITGYISTVVINLGKYTIM